MCERPIFHKECTLSTRFRLLLSHRCHIRRRRESESSVLTDSGGSHAKPKHKRQSKQMQIEKYKAYKESRCERGLGKIDYLNGKDADRVGHESGIGAIHRFCRRQCLNMCRYIIRTETVFDVLRVVEYSAQMHRIRISGGVTRTRSRGHRWLQDSISQVPKPLHSEANKKHWKDAMLKRQQTNQLKSIHEPTNPQIHGSTNPRMTRPILLHENPGETRHTGTRKVDENERRGT